MYFTREIETRNGIQSLGNRHVLSRLKELKKLLHHLSSKIFVQEFVLCKAFKILIMVFGHKPKES